jgi:hypothetical protein
MGKKKKIKLMGYVVWIWNCSGLFYGNSLIPVLLFAIMPWYGFPD